MKVMTIVGTRPEVIRLSRVIAELDRAADHVLVHTGQNYDYELNQVFFDELEIRKPDHYLDAAGATAAETIGKVIASSGALMAQQKPDALLILGDTNSCLAAIAAKRLKVPIFHMEAGNRCFDERVPEEVNRRIVDHVADINMPYTEHARRYLLSEGVRPDTIVKTGSPMREVLDYYAPKIAASEALDRLRLSAGEFFLVSAHREENIDEPEHLEDLIASLGDVSKKFRKRVIVSTHPRTRKRVEARQGALPPGIELLTAMGFADYVKLQQSATCVISDSGTLTEESAILGFPGVMIREAHERPEGMDEGAVIMAGLKPESVIEAVEVTLDHASRGKRRFASPADYAPDNVSLKVVRVILSYTDYVNRTVWYR